jgi:hypothetical protein
MSIRIIRIDCFNCFLLDNYTQLMQTYAGRYSDRISRLCQSVLGPRFIRRRVATGL